mmetsp:Transcript_28122/g.76791  ORF Transcript_28122/g.76791 Transcript_28122/m.76791 type:complete len:211 (+) Transcript_28122:84-716(+)|eukprot:scaffold2646_cov31-Tisochrysis_lutea.AAC.1
MPLGRSGTGVPISRYAVTLLTPPAPPRGYHPATSKWCFNSVRKPTPFGKQAVAQEAQEAQKYLIAVLCEGPIPYIPGRSEGAHDRRKFLGPDVLVVVDIKCVEGTVDVTSIHAPIAAGIEKGGGISRPDLVGYERKLDLTHAIGGKEVYLAKYQRDRSPIDVFARTVVRCSRDQLLHVCIWQLDICGGEGVAHVEGRDEAIAIHVCPLEV